MVPKLHVQFELYESLTEQVNELQFLGLMFDSNLNWKALLTAVVNKVSRIIGLLFLPVLQLINFTSTTLYWHRDQNVIK